MVDPPPLSPASSYPFSLSFPSLTRVQSKAPSIEQHSSVQTIVIGRPLAPSVWSCRLFLPTKTLLFSKSPLLATLVSDHTSSCPHYRKIWSNMYFSIKYHPKFCHCLHSDIMKMCFHKRYKFTFWVKSADHPQRV